MKYRVGTVKKRKSLFKSATILLIGYWPASISLPENGNLVVGYPISYRLYDRLHHIDYMICLTVLTPFVSWEIVNWSQWTTDGVSNLR